MDVTTREEQSRLVEEDLPRSGPRKRLPGVDVFRGIAAFGVIYIHAGLVVDGKVSSGSLAIAQSFDFAVPFFLLASFFFAARSTRPETSVKAALSKRAVRLMAPYLLWTLVYTALKCVKFVYQGKRNQLGSLFADPIGLFLFGGSGVHLYFLPLLFVGLIALTVLAKPARRIPSGALGGLLLAAIVAKVLLDKSGNAFDMSSGRAFTALCGAHAGQLWDPPVRILLVLAAHTLRCLPMVLLAFLLVRHVDPFMARFSRKWALVAGGLLFAGSLWAGAVRLPGMPEEFLGFGAFIFAYALSAVLPQSRFILKMGVFSFGIYLVHQIPLEMLQLGLHRSVSGHGTFGIPAIFGISVFAFGASWILMEAADRSGKPLKRLFAIET